MHFKKIALTAILAIGIIVGAGSVSAAPYTVKGMDTMWLISQHHKISLNELIKANPQISNPNQIWPGLVLNLPGSIIQQPSSASYANQVVAIVNEEL